MCKFAYGFSTGIALNILIIYGKDPNFKARRKRESKNTKQEKKKKNGLAVYRLRHSETNKKHCLIRESCLSRTCSKNANRQYS